MGIEKNTPVSTPAPVMVNNGEKPKTFNSTEFKRWQQKMMFYLTTLNLARFLHEESPALIEGETDKQVVAAVEAYLIVRLRIEEDNHASEKKARKTFTEAKANMVEHRQNPKKRKNPSNGPKQRPNDNKKFKGKCYVCNKLGHRAKDCRKRKDQGYTSKKPAQANMTELDTLSTEVSDINLSAMVLEINLVGNTREWWVDTRVTRHVCSSKEMFSTYHASNG
ncbi:hypothetical protein AAC387_Pa01g1817 [Persea americana]